MLIPRTTTATVLSEILVFPAATVIGNSGNSENLELLCLRYLGGRTSVYTLPKSTFTLQDVIEPRKQEANRIRCIAFDFAKRYQLIPISLAPSSALRTSYGIEPGKHQEGDREHKQSWDDAVCSLRDCHRALTFLVLCRVLYYILYAFILLQSSKPFSSLGISLQVHFGGQKGNIMWVDTLQ
jgi:hypothetical protein